MSDDPKAWVERPVKSLTVTLVSNLDDPRGPSLLMLASELNRLLFQYRERLPMFTVTASPSDYPGRFVARLWLTLPALLDAGYVMHTADLEKLRDVMTCNGLVRMAPDPGDDPAILETWL